MNFIKRLTVLFTVVFVMLTSGFLLLYALNYIDYANADLIMQLIYTEQYFRYTTVAVAGVMLFVNFLLFRFMSVNIHRDKIIAFNNPSGQVSLSLFAMEDLVQKMISRHGEIRDAKTKITAGRKSLKVRVRMILTSEVNIPDLTSSIQDEVKKKIQDIIGLEEPVDVSIYVGKILTSGGKKVSGKEKEAPQKEKEPEPNIPFSGYRA